MQQVCDLIEDSKERDLKFYRNFFPSKERGRGLVEFVIVGGRFSPMCLVFALSENPGIALMLGQASGLRMQVDYQINMLSTKEMGARVPLV